MSINLSKKYGVNPSLEMCFVCGEPKGVALFGKLKDDQPAPRECVFDYEPCDKCKEWTKRGIILISVRDGESGTNPYRTGGWIVLKEEVFKRIFSGSEVEDTLKKRVCFIMDEVWDKVGLPRGEVSFGKEAV